MGRKNDLTVKGYLADDSRPLDVEPYNGRIPDFVWDNTAKDLGVNIGCYAAQHRAEWAAVCADLDRRAAERAAQGGG